MIEKLISIVREYALPVVMLQFKEDDKYGGGSLAVVVVRGDANVERMNDMINNEFDSMMELDTQEEEL